jgi:hypothetical protein
VKRSAKAVGPSVPSLSRAEAKHDATTRAAKDIVDRASAVQDAKTARLRAARLARDASESQPLEPLATARRRKAKK